MQQQTAAANTDELFGLEVTRYRQALGLSQREFAAALVREGMNVDASAVSRIEKGTRSVRLVEAAAIANALGVGLPALVRESTAVSPSATLRGLRQAANTRLRKLGEELWLTLSALWEVVDHLETHPELLREIEGDPSSAADYLAGIAERLDQWPVSDEELTFFMAEQIPQVEALFAKFLTRYIGHLDARGDAVPLLKGEYSDGYDESPA